jgi:SH3 domain-containing YSC84-like protein 1
VGLGLSHSGRARGRTIAMRHLFAGIILFAFAASAVASDTPAERLKKAADIVEQVMHTPEQGIPQDLLDKAVCVAVVPGYKKAAFGIGGSFGKGALVCRGGGTGPWGAPSMFTLGGPSIGFQIGGSSSDLVLVVMNGTGAQKLLKSKVKLGADASVAGGPVGRTSEASTDALMNAEILTYSRSRGAFAGLSLGGAVIKVDNDANQELYGRKLTAQDILFKNEVGVPAAARSLDAELTKYSPHGGQKF